MLATLGRVFETIVTVLCTQLTSRDTPECTQTTVSSWTNSVCTHTNSCIIWTMNNEWASNIVAGKTLVQTKQTSVIRWCQIKLSRIGQKKNGCKLLMEKIKSKCETNPIKIPPHPHPRDEHAIQVASMAINGIKTDCFTLQFLNIFIRGISNLLQLAQLTRLHFVNSFLKSLFDFSLCFVSLYSLRQFVRNDKMYCLYYLHWSIAMYGHENSFWKKGR